MNGIICSTPIYEYQGWIFEYGPTGCWPLKNNGLEYQAEVVE